MFDVAEKLTTQSEDFSKMLYIFAEKSQRYICFNKKWKLVGLVITLARQLVDIFHYRALPSKFIRVYGSYGAFYMSIYIYIRCTLENILVKSIICERRLLNCRR